MDLSESIEYIARSEARRVRPIRREDELVELEQDHGRPLNAIQIRRRPAGGGFEAVGLEREPGHDNAPRLAFLVDFFNRRALPLVDPTADGVCGMWRVELHDAYSYLPDSHRYAEVLTFGRPKDAAQRRVALIPDPYHMADFGGMLDQASRDAVPWERKAPVLFFAGTTTGDRDPAKNVRLRACQWALDVHRDVAKMHITKIAQMEPSAVLATYPRFRETYHAPFSIDDHFAYRYQVNLVGNTACWSRVPMVMSTKCLLVHPRTSAEDAMWYYPLLRENRHYVGVESANAEHMLGARLRCLADDRACRAMVVEANAVAKDLFRSSSAATYLAAMLEERAFLE